MGRLGAHPVPRVQVPARGGGRGKKENTETLHRPHRVVRHHLELRVALLVVQALVVGHAVLTLLDLEMSRVKVKTVIMMYLKCKSYNFNVNGVCP